MRRKIVFKLFVLMAITLFWNTAADTAEMPSNAGPLKTEHLKKAQSHPSQDQDKVTLDLKGMDVVEVIKMLATKGGLNVAVSNNVKGRVTLFLKSVGIMDALDIILVSNELAYDRRGDILYVMSQKEYEMMYGERYADKKEVRVFQLKFAKAAEVAKATNQMKTKIGKIVADEGSNTLVVIDAPFSVTQMATMIEKIDIPLSTKIFELKYAKVADLKTKIAESLTKGIGFVQIDERTNKIVVMDLEKKMAELEAMVLAFDSKPPQVLIEAKIVQITLDDKFKLGVDWESVFKKLQKEISVKTAFQLTAQNMLVPGGQLIIGSLSSGSDYAMMIQALKEIGDTNLLSSPRITAINNQEAKILVGTSQPYATNTVIQGTSATTTATNLTFIDVGVKLYVTPTISQDGFVTMKIKPEVSSTSGNYTYGSPSTTVPIVSTTQAETSVTVKDGTTIIIAGLIKDERSSTVDKVPILGDIPVLGEMFKKTDKEVKKQEIVVFLTPHVITGERDYLDQPQTKPIGGRMFTESEKPTFERRDRIRMKPGMFKEKKSRVYRDEMRLIEEEAEKERKLESAILRGAEGYSRAVRERIIENLEFLDRKKYSKKGGAVKITFLLSPDGGLLAEPEVLESSDHSFDTPCVKAVRDAAPFLPFPESMGGVERRFVIDIAFE